MQIDPMTGVTPVLSPRLSSAFYDPDAGLFGEALDAAFGAAETYTPSTLDLMWSLQNRLTVPTMGWYEGFQIDDLPMALQQRDALLADFTRAAGAVLQDEGISLDHEIRFAVDAQGRVTVNADHPDRNRLEALFRADTVLGNAIRTVVDDTQRITMAILAEKNKAAPEIANALTKGLAVNLGRYEGQTIGDVRFNGTVLATSEDATNLFDLLAAMDASLRQFDEHERERKLAYEREQAYLKHQDQVRRDELKAAKDKDLADRLADQEDLVCKVELHPEVYLAVEIGNAHLA